LPTFHQADEKGASFIWDNARPEAFVEIMQYLMHPPVPVALLSEKLFLTYIQAMNHSLGASMAQNNDQGTEQAIYYLSRIMIGAEYHYNESKKSV